MKAAAPDKCVTELDFEHRFEPAIDPSAPTLLLLHGTGGDENDLLALGRTIAPGSALLSPRGKILENGMPRFFRRIAEGVFDLDDLARRTSELARFVENAAAHYGFRPDSLVAVGFSNGANIAASLLLTSPCTLAGAILMRAMLPYRPAAVPSLSGKRVLLLNGRLDSIVPLEQAEQLANVLSNAGAEVSLEWQRAGHGITQQDVSAAARWFSLRHASPGANDKH